MKNKNVKKQLKFSKISVSELDTAKLNGIAGGTGSGATGALTNITRVLELSRQTFCNSDAQ